jgi:hypothetical protein
MNSIIEIWDLIGGGVWLVENTGDGFKPMSLDGKALVFSGVEQATNWIMR